MTEILVKDMVAGDIVRMQGDSENPFQDMLVTKVELNGAAKQPINGLDKVHMVRPWMENQPYPMTGHEAFIVWRDSSMKFWLMRESEERRAK